MACHELRMANNQVKFEVVVSKYVLFSPLYFQLDEQIFQMGWWNHQPELDVS